MQDRAEWLIHDKTDVIQHWMIEIHYTKRNDFVTTYITHNCMTGIQNRMVVTRNTEIDGCNTQLKDCNTELNDCNTQQNGCNTTMNDCNTQYKIEWL